MKDLEFPLTPVILDEAIHRLRQYTNPKRAEEEFYILRYLDALRAYTGFVHSCIKSGETPTTFDRFVEKMDL